MNPTQQKLYSAALIAQKRAHAPYSTAHIGAAILMSDGQIFSGCNIENASYGGTVCAERVAILKAVSEGAQQPIQEILVVSDFAEPWPPCGFCRQVISEFAGPDCLVHISNTQGTSKTLKFSELFPDSFTPEHLKKLKQSQSKHND